MTDKQFATIVDAARETLYAARSVPSNPTKERDTVLQNLAEMLAETVESIVGKTDEQLAADAAETARIVAEREAK